MTTLYTLRVKCSVCGYEGEFTELSSTNTMGAPDLDLRPAPMKRNTMLYWVQECPKCHYAADKISDPCPISASFLRSDTYKNAHGIEGLSPLALSFVRAALIAAEAKNYGHAVDHMTYAAWTCDDDSTKESQSSLCRQLAIQYIDLLDLNNLDEEKRSVFDVRKVDFLRRTGAFEEAKNYAQAIKSSDKFVKEVLHFERKLCEKKDSARHGLDEVPKPRSKEPAKDSVEE